MKGFECSYSERKRLLVQRNFDQASDINGAQRDTSKNNTRYGDSPQS